MVSVTALLAAAATFWAGAAPGVADRTCPDGVRYNVKQPHEMVNKARGVGAEALIGGCVITFKAGRLRTYTTADACALVIHEYGHAAIGLNHEPHGVMDAESIGLTPPGICHSLKAKQSKRVSRGRERSRSR
jgi:hypothetical protein